MNPGLTEYVISKWKETIKWHCEKNGPGFYFFIATPVYSCQSLVLKVGIV